MTQDANPEVALLTRLMAHARRTLPAALFAVLAGNASATPLNDVGLDAIYSQASFGATPVDVRLLPSTDVVAPSLLRTELGFSFTDPSFRGEMDDLFALGGAAPAINLLFVDEIFSPFLGFILGFADEAVDGTRGNSVAISRGLSGAALDELIAHEVGHALGLDHVGIDFSTLPPTVDFDFDNLMSLGLNGKTTLTGDQVDTILQSPFVQGDATQGFFIELRPYEIVATAVPVPAPGTTWLLVGLFLVGSASRLKAGLTAVRTAGDARRQGPREWCTSPR